ncbi:MAG: hypothetical protein DRI01_10980 [Chloroflexi bacterium]|nr:MAG: hypothetical protein DRI01_10980 [Chloroflexota bacterium]
MESEKERLLALLKYLIEHNGEHSKELTELAEKSKAITKDVVLNNIRKAARTMNEATGYLKQALEEADKN